ncbi:MAG TPA: alkaline phosphatase family protein [Candidatus Limnocylindria bacterium]|nr:alkaline phosphatase family protein [Candidatus Limnocylindria bacterium]
MTDKPSDAVASHATTTAGGRRILVIGLDCATPQLVFDAWRADLPNISRLMDEGAWGAMNSTIPAITVPAWSAMMTGRDPGELGFYGFRNRADHSYDRMTIANATAVEHPRLWDRLSRSGARVGVLGVPQTFPVRPVNGAMVSCFLTPSAKSEYTHPRELRDSISDWLGEEFLVDVPNFRSDDKDRILRDIYRLADHHFDVAERLLNLNEYAFFMMVDMGVDRIHHAFWKYMASDHPKYEPNHRFEHAIHDYYVHVDRRIGRLLDLVDDDTIVVVVSDHGARTMAGGICINEWLINEGYLVLKRSPRDVTALEDCEIDWTRTRAWSAGGYYGRLFMNVKGREPEGIIEPSEYDAVRDEIVARLATITDPDGAPIGTVAYKPEDIYREVRNVAPDLIIYFGHLKWRSVGSVGFDSIWTFENDTGPDEANHAQEGIFIYRDPRRELGGRHLGTVDIYDIAPTLLTELGEPVPAGLRGRRIEW